MLNWKTLASAALLAGCVTSGGGDNPLKQVSLAETSLAGSFTLVDYLFEYGDGQTLNPSILKLEGALTIDSDSAYLERIWISGKPSDTQGKISRILAGGVKNERGELHLTLDQGDSTGTGTSTFSFHGDTLVLFSSVPKERDAERKGFKETAYYKRDSLP